MIFCVETSLSTNVLEHIHVDDKFVQNQLLLHCLIHFVDFFYISEQSILRFCKFRSFNCHVFILFIYSNKYERLTDEMQMVNHKCYL